MRRNQCEHGDRSWMRIQRLLYKYVCENERGLLGGRQEERMRWLLGECQEERMRRFFNVEAEGSQRVRSAERAFQGRARLAVVALRTGVPRLAGTIAMRAMAATGRPAGVDKCCASWGCRGANAKGLEFQDCVVGYFEHRGSQKPPPARLRH